LTPIPQFSLLFSQTSPITPTATSRPHDLPMRGFESCVRYSSIFSPNHTFTYFIPRSVDSPPTPPSISQPKRLIPRLRFRRRFFLFSPPPLFFVFYAEPFGSLHAPQRCPLVFCLFFLSTYQPTGPFTASLALFFLDFGCIDRRLSPLHLSRPRIPAKALS